MSYTAFYFRENSYAAFHLFGVAAVPFHLEMVDLLKQFLFKTKTMKIRISDLVIFKNSTLIVDSYDFANV